MAASTDARPTYIYKLVHPSPPIPDIENLPVNLPVSELDQTSGFVHMSTSKQIPNTLNFFFKEYTKVYILKVPYTDAIDETVKWEDPKVQVCGPRGGEGLFPHIYNGLKLGKDEIQSIKVLERQDLNSNWDPQLQDAEEWLIY